MICIVLMSLSCGGIHQAMDPARMSVAGVDTLTWAAKGSDTESVKRWWTTFKDPTLNSLVERLHTGNLDLRQAVTRLQQGQATVRALNSGYLPQIDGNLSAQRARGYDFLGNSTVGNQFGASIAAAYEVDVWNKLGNRVRASQHALQASHLDAQALGMSLTAHLVDLYFMCIEQIETQRLLTAQVQTNELMLQLLKERFGNGLAKATDVLQQEQNTRAGQALLPPIDARRQSLLIQIAVLIGQVPMGFSLDRSKAAELPEVGPLPALGVPADLLARRPDLKAARARVFASDSSLGAAIADRLPSFRIQASTGFGAQSFGDLLDRWVWSLASSLVGPLFDGGRRAAEVDRVKAELAGKILEFKKRYLAALGETETALRMEAGEKKRLSGLSAELDSARRLLDETQARYLEGVMDYLPVLGAIQSVHRAERNVLASRRQLLSQRVALHRALGGHWNQEVKIQPSSGDRP
jgi:multidrug efflux system outer membrane protein